MFRCVVSNCEFECVLALESYTRIIFKIMQERGRLFDIAFDKVFNSLIEFGDNKIDQNNQLWHCRHHRDFLFPTVLFPHFRICMPCNEPACLLRKRDLCPEFAALVDQIQIYENEYKEALLAMDCSELETLPTFSFRYKQHNSGSYFRSFKTQHEYHATPNEFAAVLRRPIVFDISLSCQAEFNCVNHPA